MKLIKMNNREKLYSFFETYTSLPVVDFLINFNFLYLSGLILVLYRRWRKAAIKQEELENVINSITPYVLIVVDQERNIIMCSSSLKRMYGYEVNEVINQKTDLLYSGMPSNPEHNSEILDVLGKEGFYAGLAKGKKKDGKTIPLEIITGNLRGRGGTVSLLKDITERKVMEDELRIKDWAIESSVNGIGIADLEGYLTYANNAFFKMWGYDEKEVLGKHLLKFCQKDDEVVEAIEDEGWIGEMKARRKDGSLFDVSFSASIVKDKNDNPICMMASFIDITETVQLREKLREMSINDELTGLYNRRGFLDMAERELKIAKRKKRMLVLFFVDLDGLKWINDTLGHNGGDQALIDTANILKKTFREVDILARFGGDEFVILATDASKFSAEILTARLYENLTAHNSKETCRYNLSLSIGISYYDPEIPASLEELISRVDSAMYEQKKSKRKLID